MWAQARLGSIGAIGDAALAAGCVPSSDGSGDLICGGSRFKNVMAALEWPGAAIVQDVPSVNSILPDKVFPVSFPLWDMGKGPHNYSPAATTAEAKVTGVLGPMTLVSPLPSITPIRPDRVDGESTTIGCGIASWATGNPLLALLTAVGIYFVVRGK